MLYILELAITLLAGLMLTRLFKLLHLHFPDVTVYLLTGLLVGPFFLGKLGIEGLGFSTLEEVESLNLISTVALGFIAFSIGSEFKMEKLKKSGKTTMIIGILQAVTACLLVDGALIALHFILGEEALPLTVCIVLGAIASATAPAATLMVVRQYKAKGPVTDLLLPIVALDDAAGLVLFAVSFGVAQALQGGVLSVGSILFEPLVEIMSSLLLGALLGLLLSKLESLFFSDDNRMSMTVTFVLLAIAVSSIRIELSAVTVSFSSLLTMMMLGSVFCNTSEYAEGIFEKAEHWTAPLYVAFFVISGAELDLSVFSNLPILLCGAVYILVRCIGKYLGASIPSALLKEDRNVTKYLGITLFPQAGVALGMVNVAQSLGAAEGALIRNIILMSVLVYELVGPSLTKAALVKAGEVRTPETVVKESSELQPQGSEA